MLIYWRDVSSKSDKKYVRSRDRAALVWHLQPTFNCRPIWRPHSAIPFFEVVLRTCACCHQKQRQHSEFQHVFKFFKKIFLKIFFDPRLSILLVLKCQTMCSNFQKLASSVTATTCCCACCHQKQRQNSEFDHQNVFNLKKKIFCSHLFTSLHLCCCFSRKSLSLRFSRSDVAWTAASSSPSFRRGVQVLPSLNFFSWTSFESFFFLEL